MEHAECIMTSSMNSCTRESAVENVHQIQRESGGFDNIPIIYYFIDTTIKCYENSTQFSLIYVPVYLRRCEATYVDLDCSSCISFNG